MKIAICDDEIKLASELEELVLSCFRDDQKGVEIDVFSSGDLLMKEINDNAGAYQMYLLDIEMQGIDGLETAERIRRNDDNAVIIFITSHGELMQEAFEVSAFHFLIKPLDQYKARQVILKAVESLKRKKAIIQFTIRKKVHTLFFEQIEYFESDKRKVVICLTDKTRYEYYGTFKEVIEKIPELQFVQVHNSYIINMDYISSLDGNGIEMKSGAQIALTQKFKRSFQNIYRNFILMRSE